MFCNKCGSKLDGENDKSYCQYCGRLIDKDSDYCPFCGNNMKDLAFSLDNLARADSFAESDIKALAARKELLGRDLPDTFRTMRELARKFRDLGKYLDAEPLDRLVLDRLKELLGEDHPEVLQSKEDLANDLSGSGIYEDVIKN